ncbi:MAG: aldo/keto reductase [Lachnospiraceae bacterium]|nr:aldo/keto reductase [Lachnospiraceae bacterium]
MDFIDQNSTFKLSNGVEIPCIGFGMWQTPSDEVGVNSVLSALKAGYRHIDTAQVYGNEQCIGEAFRRSDVKREEVFLTTKIWNDSHSYDLVMSSFEDSLRKLDTSYVDLLLIHWPNPLAFRDRWQAANAETWKAMEELYESGKARAIGISNFRKHHIDELLKTAKILPMVNQIKHCPGVIQTDVEEYSREKGMLLEAYSPLGTGRIFESQGMAGMSEKYGKTIAQICIRWGLQRGYLPLPKSVTPSRIEENLKVFDFEIDEDDMEYIAGIDAGVRNASNPDAVPF